MSLKFSLEDILNVLIALEKSGAKLYTNLSEAAKDLETLKLFKLLSDQEKLHQALYESWKLEHFEDVEVEQEYAEYLQSLVKHTFAVLNKAEHDALGLQEGVALAKTMEKDTLMFLSEYDQLLGGQKSEMIERIKGEERKHLKYLMDHFS